MVAWLVNRQCLLNRPVIPPLPPLRPLPPPRSASRPLACTNLAVPTPLQPTYPPGSVFQRQPRRDAGIICTPTLFLYDGESQKGKERPTHPVGHLVGSVLQCFPNPAIPLRPEVPPPTSSRKRALSPSLELPWSPTSSPWHRPTKQHCRGTTPSSHTSLPGTPSLPLSFGTVNTGGAITVGRFRDILLALQSSSRNKPLILSLSEFRPQGHPTPFLRRALECGYHLLHDAPGAKGGVGLLISSQISPLPPPLTVLIPGRLIQITIQLSPFPHSLQQQYVHSMVRM